MLVGEIFNSSLHAESEYKQSNLRIELDFTQINQGQPLPTSSTEQTAGCIFRDVENVPALNCNFSSPRPPHSLFTQNENSFV